MCGGTQKIADAPVVFLLQNIKEISREKFTRHFRFKRFFFVPLPDPTKKRFANVAALPNDVSLYRIQKLDLSNVKAADG